MSDDIVSIETVDAGDLPPDVALEHGVMQSTNSRGQLVERMHVFDATCRLVDGQYVAVSGCWCDPVIEGRNVRHRSWDDAVAQRLNEVR